MNRKRVRQFHPSAASSVLTSSSQRSMNQVPTDTMIKPISSREVDLQLCEEEPCSDQLDVSGILRKVEDKCNENKWDFEREKEKRGSILISEKGVKIVIDKKKKKVDYGKEANLTNIMEIQSSTDKKQKKSFSELYCDKGTILSLVLALIVGIGLFALIYINIK